MLDFKTFGHSKPTRSYFLRNLLHELSPSCPMPWLYQLDLYRFINFPSVCMAFFYHFRCVDYNIVFTFFNWFGQTRIWRSWFRLHFSWEVIWDWRLVVHFGFCLIYILIVIQGPCNTFLFIHCNKPLTISRRWLKLEILVFDQLVVGILWCLLAWLVFTDCLEWVLKSVAVLL